MAMMCHEFNCTLRDLFSFVVDGCDHNVFLSREPLPCEPHNSILGVLSTERAFRYLAIPLGQMRIRMHRRVCAFRIHMGVIYVYTLPTRI